MKRKTKRIASALLVLCMAVSMLFVNVPEVHAASNYKKNVTQTLKIPAYSQYRIWVEVDQPGNVKAVVTSMAKKAADRLALLDADGDVTEKQITSKKKKVSVIATAGSSKRVSFWLTNGSSKAIKYKVKFVGQGKVKVRYDGYEDQGEGVG